MKGDTGVSAGFERTTALWFATEFPTACGELDAFRGDSPSREASVVRVARERLWITSCSESGVSLLDRRHEVHFVLTMAGWVGLLVGSDAHVQFHAADAASIVDLDLPKLTRRGRFGNRLGHHAEDSEAQSKQGHGHEHSDDHPEPHVPPSVALALSRLTVDDHREGQTAVAAG